MSSLLFVLFNRSILSNKEAGEIKNHRSLLIDFLVSIVKVDTNQSQ